MAAATDEVTCLCGATVTLRAGGHGLERIGRYTLVNQVAAGGMGEIWFALMHGSNGFEKEVAVKRLLPSYANDREFIEMLVKEARLNALMNHPNIAQVYDLVHIDGTYLVVMEYVAGIAVSDMLHAALRAKIVVPWELAAVIVLQLLRGLKYAHRLPHRDGHKTVIHRDISPQNLLLTRDAVVKIVDFGIARALGEVSNTAPGIVKGKVCYQTPECIRGAAANEQSDLFPAAVVLFECLAMRQLFRGATTQEILHKIQMTRVPPMPAWRDDINPRLEKVMRRALANDPAQRYSDASALERALSRACEPKTFENMQTIAAAFLEKHAALFFTAIATHKDSPAMMPESTRKILAKAGKAPNVTLILRAAAVGEPDLVKTLKGAPMMPGQRPWRMPAMVASFALAGMLGAGLWWAEPRFVEQEQVDTLGAAAFEAAAPAESVASALPDGATAEPASFAASPGPSFSPAASPNAVLMPAGPVAPEPVQVAPKPKAKKPEPEESVWREGPDQAEINAFFHRRGAALTRCFEQAETDLDEKFQIVLEPTGTFRADFSAEQLAPYQACLSSSLKRLRFRPFDGAPVHYILPIKLVPQ